MSKKNAGPYISREAETDLSSKQYYFVEFGAAAGQVDAVDTLAEQAIGVVQNTPEAGEMANVQIFGTTKVVASAAIAEGAKVTAAAGGKAVSTTTAGHIVRAIALEAAAADGDIIEVMLVGPFSHAIT